MKHILLPKKEKNRKKKLYFLVEKTGNNILKMEEKFRIVNPLCY